MGVLFLDAVYNLLVGHEYVVGRRDCDILIPNDMSISRKHAILKVLHPEGNIAHPVKPPSLQIKDLSKLGTQLRDERISNGAERLVNSGDILSFGTAGISKYRAQYQPYIITTSCLIPSMKKALKQIVCILGGHVISEWSKECELVVMSNLSVTVKVICALVTLKPVVTVQYLEDFVKAIRCKTKLPVSVDYLPQLSDSQVNQAEVSFAADFRRQNLFQGRTFIFLSEVQFKKLQMAVELGGGLARLTDCSNIHSSTDLFLAKGTCVMFCNVSQTQEFKNSFVYVQSLLVRSKRRAIEESEIGFAVLYCSTERYCNPDVDLASLTVTSLPRQSLSQMALPGISQPQAQEREAQQSQYTAALPVVESAVAVPPPVSLAADVVVVKEEPVSQATTSEVNIPRKRGHEEISDGCSLPSKKFAKNFKFTRLSDATMNSNAENAAAVETIAKASATVVAFSKHTDETMYCSVERTLPATKLVKDTKLAVNKTYLTVDNLEDKDESPAKATVRDVNLSASEGTRNCAVESISDSMLTLFDSIPSFSKMKGALVADRVSEAETFPTGTNSRRKSSKLNLQDNHVATAIGKAQDLESKTGHAARSVDDPFDEFARLPSVRFDDSSSPFPNRADKKNTRIVQNCEAMNKLQNGNKHVEVSKLLNRRQFISLPIVSLYHYPDFFNNSSICLYLHTSRFFKLALYKWDYNNNIIIIIICIT